MNDFNDVLAQYDQVNETINKSIIHSVASRMANIAAEYEFNFLDEGHKPVESKTTVHQTNSLDELYMVSAMVPYLSSMLPSIPRNEIFMTLRQMVKDICANETSELTQAKDALEAWNEDPPQPYDPWNVSDATKLLRMVARQIASNL